ncbi:MAG TPA: hypothetical protein VI793_17410 [Anaerolineales bacterium]|nr:hypothetical protein [Anaerolineales bacterium]
MTEADGQYTLRLDHIHALAARVSAHAAPVVPEDKDEFDRAVLKAFLTPHRLSLKS